MKKPTMSVNEVMSDMRSLGMSMSSKKFNQAIDAGCFPFVKVLGSSEATGRKTVLIMRKDYEDWVEEYLR